MNLDEARKLLYGEGKISEIVIKLDNEQNTAVVKNELEKSIQKLSLHFEVHDWRYLGKALLDLSLDMKIGMRVWTMILFIAIALGILNTFMMSVYERIREIGILKAIGMKNSKILLLFFFEVFFLSLFAALLSVILSFIPYPY